VKRIFTKSILSLSFIIINSLCLTSCSSLWAHRENNAQVTTSSNEVKTVPKEQYEELVRKYQELLNSTKNSTAPVVANETAKEASKEATKDLKKDQQIKPETTAQTAIDPSELVNHIDQAIPDSKVSEGVDINSNATIAETKKETTSKAGPQAPDSMGVQHVNLTDDVDDQITKLREVEDMIKVNKFENALSTLKELENSKEKQIVVRAKVMLGDLLFGQGEYDLAMQVYEEVVKKYAFSGYVLKALGKLVACSEKLKLPEKQAKYYSLLHDFFEAV
jgi:tetratricopeptide (TPR) repeat protein